MIALSAVLLTTSLAGCGLGDKAALEELITSAPARLDDVVARGTLSVESRFISAPLGGGVGVVPSIGVPALDGALATEIPEGGVAMGEARRRFVLDLVRSRATLAAPDAGIDVVPTVILDDLVSYGRRSGVPDDDARPWVRLDLADVDDGAGELQPFDGSGAAAIVALHPAIVTDLVAGTLTGSIETVGPETVNGVETTHYSVNIAIAKALEDVRDGRYPEDRRELVERLFELLGVDGDVHPADVWLDADGGLRRFSVALVQRPLTKVEFALVVTIDITEVGGTYDVVPPTPDEVLSVDSVVRFITTTSADTGGPDETPADIAADIAAAVGAVPAAPTDPAAPADGGPIDGAEP